MKVADIRQQVKGNSKLMTKLEKKIDKNAAKHARKYEKTINSLLAAGDDKSKAKAKAMQAEKKNQA